MIRWLCRVLSDSFTNTSGTINSPNYPSSYCNLLNVTYIISATVPSTITLTFTAFDIEADSDFVSVSVYHCGPN